MPEKTVLTPGFDVTEGGEEGYRALYPVTVVSLALGILSIIAFISPAMLIVPILAILTGVWGWRVVARDSDAWTGRWMAVTGVSLAVFFGCAAFARFSSRQAALLAGADKTAMEWFGYIARNEPHKAHQLELSPEKRLPIDENLWRAYQESTKLNRQLREDVKIGGVRTLLVLGEKARVRPYSVVSQRHRENSDEIERIFLVSFEQEGKLRSFFVHMFLTRTLDRNSGLVGWKVNALRSPVLPESLEQPHRTADK